MPSNLQNNEKLSIRYSDFLKKESQNTIKAQINYYRLSKDEKSVVFCRNVGGKKYLKKIELVPGE